MSDQGFSADVGSDPPLEHESDAYSTGVGASDPSSHEDDSERKGDPPVVDERMQTTDRISSSAAAEETKVKREGPKGRFSLTVTDPEKKGDGMNQYVSYKITTKSEVALGEYTTSSVIRRYKDFEWLHSVLTRKYKGYLIPALPDKVVNVLGSRHTNEFIDERRRALESFLNRLAVHAELRDSHELELFLNADEEFLEAKADKSLDASGGFSNFFKGPWFPRMGTDRATLKTDDDRKCDKIVEYADRLDNHLTAVHSQIETLLGRSRALAKCWFDFGLQCSLLGQYETKQDEAVLGTIFSKLGSVSDLLSVMMTKKADMENIHFREPIKDYVRMVSAVREMVKTRAAAHQTYLAANADLESKRAKYEALKTTPEKAEKLAAMERQVEEAQATADERLKELKRVTAICLAEAGRFRLEKEQAFKTIVVDFVKLQIEHSKKVQKAWESILPDLQAV